MQLRRKLPISFVVATTIILAATASLTTPAFASGRIQGYAERGGQTLTTQAGMPLVEQAQRSFAFATIDIYQTGTTTHASIYSDSVLTVPKSNPFAADANAFWFAYVADGDYDVKVSPSGFAPWTITAIRVLSVDSTVCPPGEVCVDKLATAGDGVSTPYTGWETALNAEPDNSKIHFRGNQYTRATGIVVKKGWNVYGDGQNFTSIASSDTGSAFRSNFPISTVVSTTTGNGVSPIVVTLSGSHNYSTGQTLTVAGVGGNTAANGTWTITVVSPNQISLNGSTGNGAYTSGGSIPTSNIGRWTMRDMLITNSNGSNIGSGVLEVAGSNVELSNLTISGFKSNITLDQSETVHITHCGLENAIDRDLWFVNGGDYRPPTWDVDLSGASSGYTNQIVVDGATQFNNGVGPWELVDDGGASHKISGNTFNGTSTVTNMLRIAGCLENCIYEHNEIESGTGTSILTATTSTTGTSVGANIHSTISANYIQPATGQAAIDVTSGGNYVINGNTFTTTVTPVTGVGSVSRMTAVANVQKSSATLMLSAQAATFHYQVDDLQGMILRAAKGFTQIGVTFANLGTPANGTILFCTDCTVTTPGSCTNVTTVAACTCTSGGTSAFAKRINGVWLCN